MYFLNMYNLMSQEDNLVGCAQEVVTVGLDLQPLARTRNKVWIAINKNNNFVVRIWIIASLQALFHSPFQETIYFKNHLFDSSGNFWLLIPEP